MTTPSIALILFTLNFSAWANCGRANLESLPFFGRLEPARVAAERWFGTRRAEGAPSASLRDRMDRTFVRHLLNTYGRGLSLDRETVVPAGRSPLGFDLPAFRVDASSGSLDILAAAEPKLEWIRCEVGRGRPALPEHPFAAAVDEADACVILHDPELAVPMLATYLAVRAESDLVTRAIRSELDVRAHYVMRTDANFFRMERVARAGLTPRR